MIERAFKKVRDSRSGACCVIIECIKHAIVCNFARKDFDERDYSRRRRRHKAIPAHHGDEQAAAPGL